MQIFEQVYILLNRLNRSMDSIDILQDNSQEHFLDTYIII